VEAVLGTADSEMQRVSSGPSTEWTFWEDNHDGYGAPLALDLQRFFGDYPGAQCYGDILRTSVPESMMTIELSSGENASFAWRNGSWDVQDDGAWFRSPSFSAADQAFLRERCVSFEQGPDVGRDGSADAAYVMERLFIFRGWFKATTSSSDPTAAAEFAARYIGGVRLPSPYEQQPPPPGGHYAQWVLFLPTPTDDPFWLHFVYTPDSTATDINPYVLSEEVAAGRRLALNAFDRYLYNSIRFHVPTLAPHVAMLRHDGVPFLVRKRSTGAAGGSLFVTIPGSTFAFELMADTGLEDETHDTAWDMCSGA